MGDYVITTKNWELGDRNSWQESGNVTANACEEKKSKGGENDKLGKDEILQGQNKQLMSYTF